MHNALNINISKTWFVNPANGNNIYVFADVPHLIKLIRNHFVDQGFILNGTEINKHIIEKLIVFTNQIDLNIAHKISMESLHRKKAFGLSLNLQTSILDKMTLNMTNLRVKGKTGLLPFQRGVLITNNSLKLLFEDLKIRYNIKYILTYRLNQDVLENFFATIRSKGGLHDHPNPLEFKYRLRSYILGKNEGALSEAGNVEQDDTPDLESNKEILLTGQCFQRLTTSTEINYDMDPLTMELDDISYDGLENLAGFICYRLQKDQPSASTSNEASFTWTDHLSEGGLKKPSEKLMADLQQLERIFNDVNSDDLLIRKGYLSNLLALASHVDCSDNIKTLFFRSRMYFRMRVINKKLQDKSLAKKRKMSKITT